LDRRPATLKKEGEEEEKSRISTLSEYLRGRVSLTQRESEQKLKRKVLQIDLKNACMFLCVQAMVLFRLYHANSLFAGLPEEQILNL
jgi:hypothetical protein